MKRLLLLLPLVTLMSCGVDVEGIPEETDHEVTLNDGYIDLHNFCDSKYGQLTPESEQCINDGLGYKNLELELGLDADLDTYCESKDDIESCIDDITEILETLK